MSPITAVADCSLGRFADWTFVSAPCSLDGPSLVELASGPCLDEMTSVGSQSSR